ncbi:MAG: FCD domain-containing protein [Verrucomicrobiota bacterium]
MVEARQGLGTFVLEPSRSRNFQVDPATVITVRDVLDLLEFRISFESEAAALAALRHTPEQLRVIKDAVEYIQRLLESGVETKKADFDFHLAVAKATGNRYFPELLEHLGLAILPRARLDLRYISSDNAKEYLCRSNGEHREILAAITARDAEGARAAMRVHLTNSRDRLEGLYAKSDAKAPVQG